MGNDLDRAIEIIDYMLAEYESDVDWHSSDGDDANDEELVFARQSVADYSLIRDQLLRLKGLET